MTHNEYMVVARRLFDLLGPERESEFRTLWINHCTKNRMNREQMAKRLEEMTDFLRKNPTSKTSDLF